MLYLLTRVKVVPVRNFAHRLYGYNIEVLRVFFWNIQGIRVERGLDAIATLLISRRTKCGHSDSRRVDKKLVNGHNLDKSKEDVNA